LTSNVNLDQFYSIDIPLLKQIFGDKLHYHFATGNCSVDNPFDQAVIDLFPYIKENSTVLDCGCGWGGPARLLQEQLNCSVTGVTISTSQALYCRDFFEVDTADLHDYIPTKHYDTALFMESYTHLIDSAKVLSNIKDNVNSIIIKDYISDVVREIPEWHMKLRTKELFYHELESLGFKVNYFNVNNNFSKAGIDYWYNNLVKFDISQLPTHLKLLYELCNHVRSNGFGVFRSCTIYASRS